MKKVLKVIGIILVVLLVIAFLIYKFVLQYPEVKTNPKVDKWYRVSDKGMKSSDGSSYHAFYKKGKENKVMIYFAGGGGSYNEETAKGNGYNKKQIGIDALSNFTMNMGGLATSVDGNPFKDWTIILFPYATGDFHAGTGEFKYKDNNGNDKILYHYGYTNYSLAMNKLKELGVIDNPEAVVVTGYSAGAFGASLLADDVYTNYFPNAKSKNVLVDAGLLLKDDWKDILTNVWESPKSISSKSLTNNITLDCLKSLHENYGDDIHLLFDISTRDGDLAMAQNGFDTGVEEINEEIADKYQQTLKNEIPKLKDVGTYVFIWDGLSYYDDPRNMTMHTIIAQPNVFKVFEEQNKSIAGWLDEAVNGKLADYGLNLLDKKY